MRSFASYDNFGYDISYYDFLDELEKACNYGLDFEEGYEEAEITRGKMLKKIQRKYPKYLQRAIDNEDKKISDDAAFVLFMDY